jgi:5-hydroxyisourate hydrolase
MTTVTTHVLDATLGRPAAGLRVTLGPAAALGTAAAPGPVAALRPVTAETGEDGRATLGEVESGERELTFETGPWFAARGVATFYPSVTIRFSAAGSHCHVPLLLSPFGYSTYRGS